MTLFRKVFHNQAQQVGDSTAPADEDLRKALTDASDLSGPYRLDPLLHAVETADVGNMVATDKDHVSSEDHVRHPGRAANEADSLPEPEETRLQAVAMEDGEHPEMRRDGISASETKGAPDAQDEVAALLQRTLHCQSAAPEKTASSETETDSARSVAEQVPELVDDLEFGVLSAHTSEDACNWLPDEPAEADQHRSENDTSGRAADDPAQARPQETDAEKVDARAFARQQLQAMGASVSGASDPDPIPTETNEGEAIPAPAKPSAEVSDGSDIEGVPAPAVGRAGRRAGRVKTRLLGFNRVGETSADPFVDVAASTATPQREKFPVGWLVIVEGPGRGHAFSIFAGASMIGRGEDQMIRLDFGDTSISRHNHAAIAYDDETNKFYVGHGGKSNIIRRNARPVLSTEELHHADLLRIGETTLRFVALCGSDFQWGDTGDGDAATV